MNIKVPDWVIYGDNSKYIFINWLFTGYKLPKIVGKDITIVYNNVYDVKKSEERYILGTPNILPDMVLYFPIDKKLYNEQYVKIGVFEEVPFVKSDIVSLCEELHRENKGQRMIIFLVDLPRSYASTDLDVGEDDLKNAFNKYKDLGYYVKVVDATTDIDNLLSSSIPLVNYYQQEVINRINALRECFYDDEICKLLYFSDWIHVNGEEITKSTIHYEKILEFMNRRNRGVLNKRYVNIWEYLKLSCIHILFPNDHKQGLYRIKDIYSSLMEENNMAMLQSDEDTTRFFEDIKSKCNTMFDRKIRNCSSVKIDNKAFFLEYFAKYKIGNELRNLIDDFVNQEVYNDFKKLILQKCEIIEKGVSK